MKFVNVGVSVIIEKDGKMLLGRRSREHQHGVNTWCTPGGHIDYGETLEHACSRETYEETRIRIKNIRFLGITNDIFKKEKKHYVTLNFSAEHKSGKIKSTEELEDVGWYPLDNLPKPLFLCVKNYLKNHNP